MNIHCSRSTASIRTKLQGLIKNNLLLCTTLVGVILGFALGFMARELSLTKTCLLWIGLPGQLYLRLFKMLIVPLIVCAVICGASSLDPKSNGKISLIAFVFIIASNAAGAALGLGFSVLLQPGVGVKRLNTGHVREEMQTTDIFIDLIINIVPDNLFEATFAKTQTKYRSVESSLIANLTQRGINATEKYYGKVDDANITGLIFVCALFGIACAKLGDKGKPFHEFFQSASDIITTVLKWCVWITPIGVVSQIVVSIATITDVTIVFEQMGLFVATISASVLVYQLVLMPSVLFFLTKRNPFYFLMTIAEPWMISFATGNPAITIREMIYSCEVKNNIDKRVAGFVIPLSLATCCSGCALYMASATIFVANLSESSFSAKDYLLLWVLSSMAAMATPSVPNASLVSALMVMTSMNVEIDDVALLFALEWLLDRLRTTCNTVSHTFCAATVYQFCKLSVSQKNSNGGNPADIFSKSESQSPERVFSENTRHAMGDNSLNSDEISRPSGGTRHPALEVRVSVDGDPRLRDPGLSRSDVSHSPAESENRPVCFRNQK